MTPAAANEAQRNWELALTVAGLAGIGLIFVEFAFDYIPILHAFRGELMDPPWWSIVPCLVLPCMVSAGYLVRLSGTRLPSWFRALEFGLAAASAVSFTAYVSGLWVWDVWFEWSELLDLLLFVGAFAPVLWLAYRGVSSKPMWRGLVAMQGVYIVQAVFWLLMSWGAFQAGAWLAVLTVAVYFAQISLAVDRLALMSALLAPVLALVAFAANAGVP